MRLFAILLLVWAYRNQIDHYGPAHLSDVKQGHLYIC